MLWITFIKKWIFSLTYLLNSSKKFSCFYTGTTKIIYITFVIVPIINETTINENMIIKYIILY